MPSVGMPGSQGWVLRLNVDDMSFFNELHGRVTGR